MVITDQMAVSDSLNCSSEQVCRDYLTLTFADDNAMHRNGGIALNLSMAEYFSPANFPSDQFEKP